MDGPRPSDDPDPPPVHERREKRLRVIAFKVTDDEYTALQTVADLYDEGNISKIVRRAIRSWPSVSAELARLTKRGLISKLLVAGMSLSGTAAHHTAAQTAVATAAAIVVLGTEYEIAIETEALANPEFIPPL